MLNNSINPDCFFSKKAPRIGRYISRSRIVNKLALTSFLSFTILSVLILNPPVAPDDLASAATATPSTTSLTFTSTNESASVNAPLRSSNGFFATSTSEEEASFAISTNNYTGYTLSIVASDDNGLLSTANNNGGNTTPSTISSISSITSTSNFSATTTAAEAYNGKWGFRPSKYVSGNNVVTNDSLDPDYLPSPTTTPTVLDKTTTATASNTPNEYTIALGVRVDYDVPAGTYNKTFSLVATANPVAYSITYNKNTNDTVTNLPSTQASDTTNTTVTLSNTVPQRAHYSFLGWCSTQPTTSNGVDSCSGTTYNPNGNGTNLTYNINLTTANDATLYAMWKIDTFTCTKQYRLENADGTWGAYQQESTETVNYGSSCSYTKLVTDYRGSPNLANNTQGSVGITSITENTTLSLNLYRNTYTLTVSAGSNTSSASGGGSKRWGQTVAVSVTKASNVTCTTYGTPTWTQSGTAGTFSSTSGTSVNFTMGKGDATVTATSTASNVAQTITLSRSGGASGINIGGTNYTGSSVSLNCGSYSISGNYSTGYTFSSWSRADGVAVSSTSSASTTMTITGPGTLTLNGKAATYNLVITADSHTSAFSVSTDGIHAKSCTKSSNTFTCSSLTYGTNYYLYPTFANGYEFNSYQKTDSATNASLGSTSSVNTYYKMGAGNGAITMTSKSSCTGTTTLPSGTGIMQTYSISASTLASVCPGATTTLTDNRDNTTYTIGKLADGKIWLLDNLALDLTNSTVLNALSTSNTNASAASLTSLRSGNRSAGKQYANGALGNLTAGSSYSVARVNADYKDQTQPLAMSQSGTGKIGVYYNYCAVSAGSYCYGDGASAGAPSGNATEDICPKGWRMPTGGSSGEYQALLTAYSSDKAAFVNALRMPLSGRFITGSAYGQGSYGVFWSSTRYSSSYMYYLDVDASNVNPRNNYYRSYGNSVRCILGS